MNRGSVLACLSGVAHVPTPERKVIGITKKKAKLIKVWLTTATAALGLLVVLIQLLETMARTFGH